VTTACYRASRAEENITAFIAIQHEGREREQKANSTLLKSILQRAVRAAY